MARKPATRPALPVLRDAPRYKEKGADYLFPGERHGGYELCYVDRGPVNVLVDGAGFAGQTGDLFVFFPKQEHILWADTRTAPNIAGAHFELPGGAGLWPGLARLRQGPVRCSARMRDLVAALLAAGKDDSAHGRLLARVHLAELLLRAPAAPERPAAPSRRVAANGRARLAELAERLMRERLGEPLRLADLAGALCVGESTLRHAFKAAAGRGVMERLGELRAERARELLRESDCSVTEIAARVGYPTIHAFSRAFKRLVGMSPGEYSRSVR